MVAVIDERSCDNEGITKDTLKVGFKKRSWWKVKRVCGGFSCGFVKDQFERKYIQFSRLCKEIIFWFSVVPFVGFMFPSLVGLCVVLLDSVCKC